MSTYGDLVEKILAAADGATFTFDVSATPSPQTFEGAVQVLRTLTFPYIDANDPSGQNPYLWFNNPEKILPSANPVYLWHQHLSGSTQFTEYDFGVNALDCRNNLIPAENGSDLQQMLIAAGPDPGRAEFLAQLNAQQQCHPTSTKWKNRSLFLWFLPDNPGGTEANLEILIPTAGTRGAVTGLKFGFVGGIVAMGKAGIQEYYAATSTNSTWKPAAILSNGWQRFTLGEFKTPGGTNEKIHTPATTGLFKLRVNKPGRLILSCQNSDTPTVAPPVSSSAVELADTDAHTYFSPNPVTSNEITTLFRRLRGSYDRRKANLHAATETDTGAIVLPNPDVPPVQEFSWISWFTNHENENTTYPPPPPDPIALDIDWCEPTRHCIGDVSVDGTYPTMPMAQMTFNQVPSQFQSNYQVETTITARIHNPNSEPMQVALLIMPIEAGSGSFVTLLNVKEQEALLIPSNINVARRVNNTEADIIRVKVVNVCPASFYDLKAKFCVVNGGSGRFYYCIVPLINTSPPPPAPASPVNSFNDELCESNTSQTLATTLTGTIPTTTTLDSTTGSTTSTQDTPDTGVTPDTGITPDTGVTPDSGTGTTSGSGTSVTPETLTPVTEETPVTPLPPGK